MEKRKYTKLVEKVNKLDQLASKIFNYKGCCSKKEKVRQEHKELLTKIDRGIYDLENFPILYDKYNKEGSEKDYIAEIESLHAKLRVHINLGNGEYEMYGEGFFQGSAIFRK